MPDRVRQACLTLSGIFVGPGTKSEILPGMILFLSFLVDKLKFRLIYLLNILRVFEILLKLHQNTRFLASPTGIEPVSSP